MLHIILYQPEIPPNTGNIIRLAANTGYSLHLIGPLGFDINEKSVRRAGLDYHDMARVSYHDSLEEMLDVSGCQRVIAFSTKGTTDYSVIEYQEQDALLFGPETRGLPASILQSKQIYRVARLPMLDSSRSLNLSNCAAIAVYESWRQLGFNGAC